VGRFRDYLWISINGVLIDRFDMKSDKERGRNQGFWLEQLKNWQQSQ
jgi:hypothetical protein